MEKFNWKENWKLILEGEITKKLYCTAFRREILRNKVFELKCNKCGIKEWNNQTLIFEIEHKDGDNFNNHRDNLELLCPNCHSQTKTFRKKKIKNQKSQIKEEEILEQLKICSNINKVLLNLGLVNSGGNYKRIHKIIKKYNLEDFYNLPKIEKQKKLTNGEIKNIRIELIKTSNIDFSKNTWGVELGKLFNITPYGTRNWVKKNLPNFWENCAKHT